jgi:hypothetical protein
MQSKNEMAKKLAEVHRNIEPSISRIIHLVADRDSSDAEPVKLLEVNPDTFESGIWPIHFGADPPQIPFSSVVIEVTEKEFEEIRSGSLHLPYGWKLGETLYPAAA